MITNSTDMIPILSGSGAPDMASIQTLRILPYSSENSMLEMRLAVCLWYG